MAIGFARAQYVKRSAGQNACCKAAYNSRESIQFEGTRFQEAKKYDFSNREKPLYHEVILPGGIHKKFKDPEVLWNASEQKENRKNSQVALEIVLALPDDKEVSNEDRINLTKIFVEEHFVSKGIAAQIDIHFPEDKKHNYHAHILSLTRRFDINGSNLSSHKARDLAPSVAKGFVVDGTHWCNSWTKLQNVYFEEKGIALRVDPSGVVPQNHMGPIRMRGRAFSLMDDQQKRIDHNKYLSKDPSLILESLTKNMSTFSKSDAQLFIDKHVDTCDQLGAIEAFWKQKDLIQLYDKVSEKPLDRYTSKSVIEEEYKILRLVDKIYQRKINKFELSQDIKNLSHEQKSAFLGVCSGRMISCIEGYAGTGKSFVLSSLKDEYEKQGYIVRGLGPDNATVNVLKEKGLSKSENIHRFLFSDHYLGKNIQKGQELWIVDESGKLGNKSLLELLKLAERNRAQVVFSGCNSQMSSVDRGGMFQLICDRTDTYVLEDVRRQKSEKQREIAKRLAKGELGYAIDQLSSTGSMHWNKDSKSSMESLVCKWADDQKHFPHCSSIIIAYTNNEVRVLNELVRSIRKSKSDISEREFLCDTRHGKVFVSVGDKIEFRKNDKELGLINGDKGTLISAEKDKFEVLITNSSGRSRSIQFDPKKYSHYQLGYATTYFRSQGQTVDRSYVMFSPYMNKEAFYVGLTRHVNKSNLFISEQVASSLSDLKKQITNSCREPTSLEFTTFDQINEKKEINERYENLLNLQNSDSVFKKAQGYGLAIFDSVKKAVSNVQQTHLDRVKDREFYSPKVSEPTLEINIEEIKQSTEKQELLFETKVERDSIKPSIKHSKQRKESPKAVEKYRERLKETKSFKELVEADSESKSRDVKSSQFFKEWQVSCGKRNEAAYHLLSSLSKDEYTSEFSAKEIKCIRDQAERYEYIKSKHENNTYSLEEKLKERLPQLLYTLFPDGPTVRTSTGVRFGNKGAISVVTRGDRTGTYFNFEKQEGGGLLSLVGSQIGLNKDESKSWASKFIGDSIKEIPKSYNIVARLPKSSNWISQKPPEGSELPKLEELSFKYMLNTHKEVARHAYRDLDGALLFYTVRFEKKNTSGEKCVLPVSFGKFKGDIGSPQWHLKGYQSDRKPIYNQHLLIQDPKSTVLIVEGEKTADAAQRLYGDKGYVAVSWIGGAGSVSKSDWSVLGFRNVIIWPDNDKSGLDASKKLKKELVKSGVNSVRVVDEQFLEKNFPAKWDLADKLPEGITREKIDEALNSSPQFSHNLKDLILDLKSYAVKLDFSKEDNIELLLKAVSKVCQNSTSINNDEIAKQVSKILKDETSSIRDQKDELITDKIPPQNISFWKDASSKDSEKQIDLFL